MTKKKQNTTDETIIGLDIGYGATKVIMGNESIIFPSVAGHAREIKFRADELAIKYPGEQITDEDGDWFVGDLAMSQLRPGDLLRLRGRTADEQSLGNAFRLRMMKAALGKLFPGLRNGEALHLVISTGLPVDHMRDAAEFKTALIGIHRIQTDQTDFVAHVTDAIVMPQPYGTIYRDMLTDRGEINECYTYTKTGVIDIGTYTVDITLDDDGEYIDSRSGSVEAGVYTVQEVIANAYERDYRAKPHHRDIEHIIKTGCFRIKGEPVDYSQERNEAIKPLKDAVLNLINERWQAAVDIDVINVSGGGAAMVADAIKRAYPQARLVADAQLANAIGYRNYALFMAQEV